MGDLVAQQGDALTVWFTVHPKLHVDLMQHLYNTLAVKYPRVWAGSFADSAAVETWRKAWAEAFVREHITPKDVKAGLECVSTLYPDFPPTEGQFIRCCRHVDPHAAYLEALEQMRRRERGKDVWSRPAIYWAAARIGPFELRQVVWGPSFERRWSAVLQEVLTNGPFDPVPPPPAAALPAPHRKPELTGEAAKARLAELRATLGPKRRAAPEPQQEPAVPDEVIEAELAQVRQKMCSPKLISAAELVQGLREAAASKGGE